MKTSTTALLALLLTISPALATQTAQPAPQETGRVGFGCALMGGNAVELEVEGPTYTVRMSLWGESLGQLRGEKKVEINGENAADSSGTAQFCRKGSPCSPITARFELTSGGPVAGTRMTGNMFWYDPNVDHEVSLPLAATVAPRQRNCR